MTKWSEDERAEAIKLRRERWSAARIGKKLNRSRNAVIGALHRAGEPGVLGNQYSDGGVSLRPLSWGASRG